MTYECRVLSQKLGYDTDHQVFGTIAGDC